MQHATPKKTQRRRDPRRTGGHHTISVLFTTRQQAQSHRDALGRDTQDEMPRDHVLSQSCHDTVEKYTLKEYLINNIC